MSGFFVFIDPCISLEEEHVHLSEPLFSFLIVRESFRDQCPKTLRMIEFPQVAELMDDDVVGELQGKERDAVIEIEIPLHGTASPPRTLVADSDALVFVVIELVPVREPFMCETAC